MEKQIAKLNYLRMAPRKVRLVASLLRGLSVNEAEAQLIMMRKRATQPLIKLIRSAVAGAKNKKMDIDKLIVESIMVDGGPMLKRFMPRAQGRMAEIQKKMSHVTLTLAENDKVVKKYTIVVPKKEKHLAHEENAKPAKVAPKPKKEKTVAKKGTTVIKKVFSKNTQDTSGGK